MRSSQRGAAGCVRTVVLRAAAAALPPTPATRQQSRPLLPRPSGSLCQGHTCPPLLPPPTPPTHPHPHHPTPPTTTPPPPPHHHHPPPTHPPTHTHTHTHPPTGLPVSPVPWHPPRQPVGQPAPRGSRGGGVDCAACERGAEVGEDCWQRGGASGSVLRAGGQARAAQRGPPCLRWCTSCLPRHAARPSIPPSSTKQLRRSPPHPSFSLSQLHAAGAPRLGSLLVCQHPHPPVGARHLACTRAMAATAGRSKRGSGGGTETSNKQRSSSSSSSRAWRCVVRMPPRAAPCTMHANPSRTAHRRSLLCAAAWTLKLIYPVQHQPCSLAWNRQRNRPRCIEAAFLHPHGRVRPVGNAGAPVHQA